MSFSNQRGRVHVAIDFSQQIKNFPNHKVDGRYIYRGEKYQIFSFNESLHDDKPFFTAQNIVVYFYDTAEQILLEDFAFNWITNPERKIRDLNSLDFLEQTSITHSLWRIREMMDGFEPFNDVRKEYYKEDRKVLDSFLRILDPSIQKISNIFNKIYRVIEYGDIYSQALLFTTNMLAGESQKNIEIINKFILENQNKKQATRQYVRGQSIHPLHSRNNNFPKHINIKDIQKGTIESIFDMVRTSNNQEILETAILMLKSDSLASYQANTINYNSNKVYKPWFDQTIVDFIFGKKHNRLFNQLKDHFKSDINRAKKKSTDQEYDDTLDYKNIEPVPRRWKFYIESKEIKKEYLSIIEKLPPKQREAYLNFVSGRYNSSNQKERQNLNKAKKKLIGMDLLGKIPLPKSKK